MGEVPGVVTAIGLYFSVECCAETILSPDVFRKDEIGGIEGKVTGKPKLIWKYPRGTIDLSISSA